MKSLGVCYTGAEGGRSEGGPATTAGQSQSTSSPASICNPVASSSSTWASHLLMVSFPSATSLVGGRPLSQGYQGLCASHRLLHQLPVRVEVAGRIPSLQILTPGSVTT